MERGHLKRRRDVASETEVTAQQLQDAVEQTQSQINIIECLEKAWKDPDSGVRLVLRNPPTDYVFAVTQPIWDSIIDESDLGEKEGEAARKWHMVRGNDLAVTSKTGRAGELDSDELFLVLRLPLVEKWQWAKTDLAMWFEELGKQGLSPAEILDFWAIEKQGYHPQEWSDSRGVTPEAVRKNTRQAKQKLDGCSSLYPS